MAKGVGDSQQVAKVSQMRRSEHIWRAWRAKQESYIPQRTSPLSPVPSTRSDPFLEHEAGNEAIVMIEQGPKEAVGR